MRLVKAKIEGFGRLKSGAINLDNKVLAIVGPNEAGKSTLLKALAFIDNKASLGVTERSRGANISDDAVVVQVQYILEESDVDLVSKFNLEQQPQHIWLSRTATGASWPDVNVFPIPQKKILPLINAVKTLRRRATAKQLELLDPPFGAGGEAEGTVSDDDGRISVRQLATETLTSFLDDAVEGQEAAAANKNAAALHALQDSLALYGLSPSFSGPLEDVIAWTDQPDPGTAVAEALWRATPNIELFGDQDRSLASTYSISEAIANDPPAALRNVAAMAELKLDELWQAMVRGDEGERETLIDTANQTLRIKFADAWRQSDVSVWLKTEGTELYIRIKQGASRITQFDERSAGLQMFVALVAFLAVRNTQRPPVLLIDEAENHLHIDAQADLVNTFMTQTQAAKIIYTTHSPACLPPDLGSNIRAVVPDAADNSRSIIQGSFWHGTAGFSPLMLAMGAGAAAFSAARFVVLAEGASEMLLLPSLIKRAVGLSDLSYQVAPGLSEVPADLYPELDLIGARVAYLVDDDKGGQDRRKSLIQGGVDEQRIISLGALTLENTLEESAYIEVLGILISECNPARTVPRLPELPAYDSSVWPATIESWASLKGLRLPGKRVVASRLVEENKAQPSAAGVAILKKLHEKIQTLLGS
ncbi:AAA family ATPase [Clavibacter zhangzhiyongii]|uniref:AAA family ATPase n=1 Tax=Clavibacter zhangzhiyongii TaxID=2768071 RepID=UPI0039DFDB44